METNFEPWASYPSLTRERLSTIVNIIRRVRSDALLLHEAVAGDSEWSLGCRVYARTCHALRQAANEHEWLTILPEPEKPLRFTFAIGSIPIRFYHGEAGDPPIHYLATSYGELQARQLAMEIDGVSLRQQILRLAVETDETGQVSCATLVEMDETGHLSGAYAIPFDAVRSNLASIQANPVNLPAPEVEPIEVQDKQLEAKYRDGNS